MVGTYVSIAATCPDSCQFKAGACYVLAGFTGKANRILDEGARHMTGADVIRREVEVLDGLFGGGAVPQDGGRDGKSGRDLRLHVGGDTPGAASARALAAMAKRWRLRGGGGVYTYTHRWREIPVEMWGEVSVLASCETWQEVRLARRRGYVPAIVVAQHPEDGKAYMAPDAAGHDAKVVPCPAETRGTTCVQCRLCLQQPRLESAGIVISFAIHGRQRRKITLPVMR